jgi:hypothetical protein
MDINESWYKESFIQPITSAVIRFSCKPLTIVYCHHRRPREANIFRIPSAPSGRGCTINFSVTFCWNTIFLKVINKNIADRHQYQITLSKNVCLEKFRAAQNKPNRINIQDDSSSIITNSVPNRISITKYRTLH